MADNTNEQSTSTRTTPGGTSTPIDESQLSSVINSLTLEIKKLNEQYKQQAGRKGTSDSTRRTHSYTDDFERSAREATKSMTEFQKQLASIRKQTSTEIHHIARDLESLSKEATGSAKAIEEYRLKRLQQMMHDQNTNAEMQAQIKAKKDLEADR